MSDPRYRARDLWLLVLGNAVSTLGSSVYLVAVLLLLKDLTGSAFVMGAFQFLAISPGFFLSPITGALIDRVSRRSVIINADLFRGVVMIAAGVLMFNPALLGVHLVLPVAFLIGIGNAFFVPAVQALIPSIVPPERLQAANGIRAAGTQIFNLAGNAVGGILYVLMGAPLLFVANGASFVVSAAQEAFIRRDEPPPADPPTASRPTRGILGPAREGLAIVVGSPHARRVVVSQAGLFLLSPVLLLSLPFIVIDQLLLPAGTLGYVFASALAGGIAAFAFLGRNPRLHRSDSLVPFVSYAAIAVVLGVLAIRVSLPVVVVAAVLFGAASGAVYLYVVTWIQHHHARELHGRLFAILEAATAAVGPAGYVVTGILLDLLGVSNRFWLFAVAGVAAGAWSIELARSRRSAVAIPAPSRYNSERDI